MSNEEDRDAERDIEAWLRERARQVREGEA